MKKTKYLLSIVIAVMMFSFLVSPIGKTVNAQELIIEAENQAIDEVAEKLEFIWEEASIKDASGKIVGIDIEKIENKYGSSEDLEALKYINEFNMTNESDSEESDFITPYSAAVDACVSKEVSAYFGAFLSPAVAAAIYELLWKGEYTEAAKKLIKIGIKGNVFVIAGTLTIILGDCIIKEEGWV